MATVLGIHPGHDAAAAIIHEGKLVSAISNERISRVKKAPGVTPEMIDYVLSEAGLDISDLDYVAFTFYVYAPDNYVKVTDELGQDLQINLIDLTGGEAFRECFVRIGNTLLKGVFVHHHIAHCASAFYTSPFETAACLSVDASMYRPEACSVYAYGQGNNLFYHSCPGIMIGNAYSLITEKLGLGPGLFKAGTTMGLAAYGEASTLAKDEWLRFGESFYERKSQPSDILFINHMWGELSGLAPHEIFSTEQSDSTEAMNIAASLQHIFEETLLHYSEEFFAKTAGYHGSNLCLSGGSFLNCDANMRIAQESRFENTHIFPACGDDGTAVGAALYVTHHLLGVERHSYTPKEYMYTGKVHPIPEGGVPYQADKVAQAIAEGKVVAWFQGKSEFGPRALGNRSILADPRSPEMRDYLNNEIKGREWFRPFAPSVLAEKREEWFDLPFESPAMLYVARCKKPDILPAVSHIDNTSRVQTVRRDDNEAYYDLISAFEAITGVPLVLNTSLNVNGEPLVESPADALSFFNSTKADLLVLGNAVISKE